MVQTLAHNSSASHAYIAFLLYFLFCGISDQLGVPPLNSLLITRCVLVKELLYFKNFLRYYFHPNDPFVPNQYSFMYLTTVYFSERIQITIEGLPKTFLGFSWLT